MTEWITGDECFGRVESKRKYQHWEGDGRFEEILKLWT